MSIKNMLIWGKFGAEYQRVKKTIGNEKRQQKQAHQRLKRLTTAQSGLRIPLDVPDQASSLQAQRLFMSVVSSNLADCNLGCAIPLAYAKLEFARVPFLNKQTNYNVFIK